MRMYRLKNSRETADSKEIADSKSKVEELEGQIKDLNEKLTTWVREKGAASWAETE